MGEGVYWDSLAFISNRLCAKAVTSEGESVSGEGLGEKAAMVLSVDDRIVDGRGEGDWQQDIER